ncbi:MAG: hypothetical protein QM541_11950 [Flavobacterium sp.]|nr:hypothetical protein [Flavobacterium sp.]
MTTYILFNTIILSLLFLFIICLFFWARQNNFFKSLIRENDNANNRLGWKVIVSLVLSILFIAFAFIAPFVFTRDAINDDFDFKETGPIGDTIGGLMNPFIAIAGVIITGLAFYIQYKANEEQRDQFVKKQEESKKQFQLQLDKQDLQNRIQQFESQFYEMLRLHRENVTEMKINGYNFNKEDSIKKVEKITEGRKVFVTMQTEFECILKIFTITRKLDKQTFNL